MIYVSSDCMNAKRIDDILSVYGRIGIRNIELSGGTAFYSEIEADLVKNKEKYGLNYVCHSYFPPNEDDIVINLASCNDYIYKRSINHYEECIKLLKRQNISVLSIHSGFLIEVRVEEIGRAINPTIVYDEDEAYQRFIEAYRHISKLCKENGISLYLENNVLSKGNYQRFNYHNYFMMTDYKSIMRMKKKLDFNLLLDLGHLHVSAGTLGLNYEQECKLLAPYTKWIHISENDGCTDLHNPLIDGSRIMSAYEEYFDKKINITLETKGNEEEIKNSMNLIEKYLCI